MPEKTLSIKPNVEDISPLASEVPKNYESTVEKETDSSESVGLRRNPMSGFIRRSSFAVVQMFSAENTQTHEGSSWGWGALIMMNTIIGFGALTLPSAVQMAGPLWIGLSIEVVCFILLYTALLVVGYVSTEHRSLPTYESLFRHYFAPWVERVVAVIILAVMYVPCVAYLVAVKGQFSTLVLGNVDRALSHSWYLQPTFLMFVISIVIIFPMCLLQHIDHLRQASAVASVCVIYLAVVVIITYFYPEKFLNPILTSDPQNVDVTENRTWSCTLVCVGSFVTAFCIQFVGPPVYVRTKPKTFRNYVKMSTVSMFACFTIYNILIIMPNLTTSSLLYEDILLNLNPTNPTTIVAYVLYILKLCLEYPILHFVGREGILTIMPEYWYETRLTGVKMFISVLWYSSTLGLAALVPEILTATQIVGFVASPVALLLPSLLLLKNLKVYPIANRVKHYALNSMGIFMATAGCAISIIILINTVIAYIRSYDPTQHNCTGRV